jgi:hypothetical protein
VSDHGGKGEEPIGNLRFEISDPKSPPLPFFRRCRNVLAMDSGIHPKLVPGAKVTVTQQIVARHYTLPAIVSGTVVQFAQKQTGSWFAHSRDDKLWLDRLTLRKDDGEITTLILDEFSVVDIEAAPAS